MKSASARQDGYTIIEVIIFLAISSVLLISVIGLLNGRVQGAQFTQAVQSLDTKIRTTANETATGTYPSTPSFSCTIVGGAPQTNALGAGEQGERSACIFAGKIMNFTPRQGPCADPVADSRCEQTQTATVIGRRVYGTDGKVVAGLTGVNGAAPRTVIVPNLTQTYDLNYGTRVSGVYKKTTPLTPITAVGFFQSFNGNYDTRGLSSGSQGIEMWTVARTTNPVAPLNDNELAVVVAAEQMEGPAAGNEVLICLKNGNNNRNASITLRNAGGIIASSVKIGDTLCP